MTEPLFDTELAELRLQIETRTDGVHESALWANDGHLIQSDIGHIFSTKLKRCLGDITFGKVKKISIDVDLDQAR